MPETHQWRDLCLERPVTAEDLLYGCLLPSGAEASTALAIHIGGSVDKFIDMMNQKALELGYERYKL